jgi:hypothetical protein
MGKWPFLDEEDVIYQSMGSAIFNLCCAFREDGYHPTIK